MSSRLPVAVIEAAYRVDLPQREWLGELARTMQALNGSEQGALAVLYDASRADWVAPLDLGSHGLPPGLAERLFAYRGLNTEDTSMGVQAYRAPVVAGLRSAPLPKTLLDTYGSILDGFGIADVLCVNATDPTHHGCLTLLPSPPVKLAVSTAQMWRRLGAHVAAGARLRRSLDNLESTETARVDHAEAVLQPNGHVDHAVGPASDADARESLRDSIARVERARSTKPTPEEAVALWEALVAGRWSVVEHFERDGKRYYLAHRNDTKLAVDHALTLREQQALAFAGLGYSNKLTAYCMGLATSTVATLLTSARRKLGPRRREDDATHKPTP